MESRDKPLATERNETPEWEEEVVAENIDTVRVDVDNGGEMEKEVGGRKKKEKEMKEGRERGELGAAKDEERMKAKKAKAVATEPPAQGGPRSSEYILDGFDFSTGTILLCMLHWNHERTRRLMYL